MTIRPEEIRAGLAEFASRWSVYDGSERAEAQTFLNELFDCYGTRRPAVATFEEHQSGKFLDCIWPRNCIIEMKAPGEAKRLARHRAQALDYWRNSSDPMTSTPAPRYVVICAFRTLEVWEPGAYPNEPCAVLDLVELPERYETLLFLTGEGEDAVFTGSQQQVTREAVGKVSELFHLLADRSAASEGELQDFLLQSVWCMFAEDLAMIPAKGFTRLLEDLITNPRRSSADDLGRMFELLNSPPNVARNGLYKDVPYANGGLFTEPTHVHLERDELRLLLDAARDYRWNEVEPSIFGSLLEGGLGRDQQWALGAHYTHEVDIQKVVQPTIVRPWRERIENCTTLKQATEARRALSQYVVLDPACGSGNFLYVAYRELRRIERDLNEQIAELERHAGRSVSEGMTMGSFPLSNMRGIELEGFAVKLARVTLWMGHKLAIDEVGLAEDPLPLADLSGIRRGDALRVEWPKADAIIGNPPFHGDRNLRGVLGDDYVEWLKQEFDVGIKDYCVYWFRGAVDHLRSGGRAGLVATNSISQNRGRSASLDYVVQHGGTITNAVSTQVWPGEAKVHVSIVNWVQGEAPTIAVLDGVEVPGINPSLRSTGDVDVASARQIPASQGIGFQGQIPRGMGFVLHQDEAEGLLQDGSAPYRDVVRPYLTGDDLVSRPDHSPSRFVVDFGEMPLEEAFRYPRALEIVEARVRPQRQDDPALAKRWWLHWNPRPAMRAALEPLDRFAACARVGKRVQLAWFDTWTCPSDLAIVFAVADDERMGMLASRFHAIWARAMSSTLKGDIRYTPTTALGTFPFPKQEALIEHRVGDACREYFRERDAICIREGIGLTELHNQLDKGAWQPLSELRAHLDTCVAAAYGFADPRAADDDVLLGCLLKLNHDLTDSR